MTVALGLAAALCWAIDNLLSVRITRAIPTRLGLFWSLLGGLLVGLPVWLLWEGLPAELPPLHSLAVTFAAAPCYLAGNAFFLLALRRGSLSIVAPLVGLEGGIAAVIGVLALGQAIAALTAVGLAVAVIGGSLAAADRGARAVAGAGWALASATAFAATFVCYGEAGGISPLGMVLGSRAVSVVLLCCWLLVRREPLAIPAAMQRATLGLGSLDVLAFTLFATAASIGPLAVASVSGAQFAPLAAAIGVVVLGERLRVLQYVGVFLTLAAVVVLSLNG
jgi:drug/metabolite transporter (DMT)-like permease